MRELEFRCWNADAKCWKNESETYMQLENQARWNPELGESYPLMQYTGLKDKNRVKIFEGDLISHVSRNGGKPHPIVFNKGAFCGDYGLVYPLNQEHFDKYCEITVVGNIYENPELV